MESHILNSYHQARYRSGHQLLRSSDSSQTGPEYVQPRYQPKWKAQDWSRNETINMTRSQDTSSDEDETIDVQELVVDDGDPQETPAAVEEVLIEGDDYDVIQVYAVDPNLDMEVSDDENSQGFDDYCVKNNENSHDYRDHDLYNVKTNSESKEFVTKDINYVKNNENSHDYNGYHDKNKADLYNVKTNVKNGDYCVKNNENSVDYHDSNNADLYKVKTNAEAKEAVKNNEKIHDYHDNDNAVLYNVKTNVKNNSEAQDYVTKDIHNAQDTDLIQKHNFNLDPTVVSNVDDYFKDYKDILTVKDEPVVQDVDEYFIKEQKPKLYVINDVQSQSDEQAVENVASEETIQETLEPLNEILETLPNIEDLRRFLLEDMTYTKFKTAQAQRSCSLPQSPMHNICLDIDDTKTCLSFEDLDLDLTDIGLSFDNHKEKSNISKTDKSEDVTCTLTEEDVNSFLITNTKTDFISVSTVTETDKAKNFEFNSIDIKHDSTDTKHAEKVQNPIENKPDIEQDDLSQQDMEIEQTVDISSVIPSPETSNVIIQSPQPSSVRIPSPHTSNVTIISPQIVTSSKITSSKSLDTAAKNVSVTKPIFVIKSVKKPVKKETQPIKQIVKITKVSPQTKSIKNLISTPKPKSNVLDFCIEKTSVKKIKVEQPTNAILKVPIKVEQPTPTDLLKVPEDFVDVESCNGAVIPVLEANNLSSLLEQFEATEKLNTKPKKNKLSSFQEQIEAKMVTADEKSQKVVKIEEKSQKVVKIEKNPQKVVKIEGNIVENERKVVKIEEKLQNIVKIEKKVVKIEEKVKNALTNGMRIKDAGVQLNKNKMRQILMPSPTVNTSIRRSTSPAHSDHDYCSTKKRYSLPNIKRGQSLLKPEVLENNRILKHRACKNKVIYNTSSDDEQKVIKDMKDKIVTECDVNVKTMSVKLKSTLNKVIQQPTRKKIPVNINNPSEKTPSVNFNSEKTNSVNFVNDFKRNNSVIDNASKASDTSSQNSNKIKLVIKNKSEVIINCDVKDSQKVKSITKCNVSEKVNDTLNIINNEKEEKLKNTIEIVKNLDSNENKDINLISSIGKTEYDVNIVCKVEHENSKDFYTGLFENKLDLQVPQEMQTKTEKRSYKDEISIEPIEEPPAKKKKLNLQEYKLRRGVNSNNSSTTVSPEPIFPEMPLQVVKIVKPIPNNVINDQTNKNLAPPDVQKNLFDPIKDASRKILMNSKKIKAQAMRRKEDIMVMRKIPKIENLELQPLISDAEMQKIVGMVPNIQPEEKIIEKSKTPSDYEEKILVSVGVNTDDKVFKELEKSLQRTVPQSPKSDTKGLINFRIKKSDQVVQKNVFEALKKAKKSADNDPTDVKMDKDRFKYITATLKSVQKQVDTKMSSNSLFASIKDVVKKKAPEQISSKPDTRAKSDSPKRSISPMEIKTVIVRDYDTSVEHGEDKIILHLEKDRSKPESATTVTQTDPISSTTILRPQKKLINVKEQSQSPRKRNESDKKSPRKRNDTEISNKSNSSEVSKESLKTQSIERENRSKSARNQSIEQLSRSKCEKRSRISRSKERFDKFKRTRSPSRHRRRSSTRSRSKSLRSRERSRSRSREISRSRYRRYRRSDSPYRRRRRSSSYRRPSSRYRSKRSRSYRSRSKSYSRSRTPRSTKSRSTKSKTPMAKLSPIMNGSQSNMERSYTPPPLPRQRTESESSTSSSSSSSSGSSDDSRDSRDSRSTSRSDRSESYRRDDRKKYRSFSSEDREAITPVEERRIVFVGRLEQDITKAKLRSQFKQFGPVIEVRLHTKDDGSRYGFVTFECARDAWTTVESAKTIPQYDIGFGGRRAFCRQSYADLDGLEAKYTEFAFHGAGPPLRRSNDLSFEQMLQDMKLKLSQRKTKEKGDDDD